MSKNVECIKNMPTQEYAEGYKDGYIAGYAQGLRMAQQAIEKSLRPVVYHIITEAAEQLIQSLVSAEKEE